MPDLTDRGRLLRGGRVMARLLLVWTLVAVSLHLLDRWLTDFAMPLSWQPTVFAAMLGLLSAVVVAVVVAGVAGLVSSMLAIDEDEVFFRRAARRFRRDGSDPCDDLLVRSARSGPVVLGRDGVRSLRDDSVTGEDPLSGYGPHAADLIRRTDGFAHCPDILVNSRYHEATEDASPFEVHVGSHGGLGGGRSRGFLMYPADLPAPVPEKELVAEK